MTRSQRPQAHKGRGAGSNPAGRFEAETGEVFDDGWGSTDEYPEAPETIVRPDPARTIITRNQSPDIPFEASINPYRGCEHGCPYCLDGDTPVLMGDGSHKPISALKKGDAIIGTRRAGHYRRYVATTVRAHWSSIKPAHRIILADGTQLVASAEHRFLTERGWKHVLDTPAGRRDRAHLTTNNKLMGTGAFAAPPVVNAEYRTGYLCGLLRGDAHIGSYQYRRAGRKHGNVYRFRLALADGEALIRADQYLAGFGVTTGTFVFQRASGGCRALNAIRTSARSSVEAIVDLISWPPTPSDDWRKGFLAGIFDAEGHYGNGTVRISNTDAEIIE
ncbi:MAG: hypothetical protein L0H75_07985, partial [Nitrosospira sp.]|nr:hypothetical protein [Nitrosospira sp.]